MSLHRDCLKIISQRRRIQVHGFEVKPESFKLEIRTPKRTAKQRSSNSHLRTGSICRVRQNGQCMPYVQVQGVQVPLQKGVHLAFCFNKPSRWLMQAQNFLSTAQKNLCWEEHTWNTHQRRRAFISLIIANLKSNLTDWVIISGPKPAPCTIPRKGYLQGH